MLNDVNCRMLRYQQKLLRNQNNFCKSVSKSQVFHILFKVIYLNASHYKTLFTVHYCTDESPLSITSSLWSVRKNRVTCEIHSHCTFASAWRDPVCKKLDLFQETRLLKRCLCYPLYLSRIFSSYYSVAHAHLTLIYFSSNSV